MAKLYWWLKSGGHMKSATFEKYISDEFDVKLTELANNPEVCIIEIVKYKDTRHS